MALTLKSSRKSSNLLFFKNRPPSLSDSLYILPTLTFKQLTPSNVCVWSSGLCYCGCKHRCEDRPLTFSRWLNLCKHTNTYTCLHTYTHMHIILQTLRSTVKGGWDIGSLGLPASLKVSFKQTCVLFYILLVDV